MLTVLEVLRILTIRSAATLDSKNVLMLKNREYHRERNVSMRICSKYSLLSFNEMVVVMVMEIVMGTGIE